MVGKKRDDGLNERIERIGRKLVRASAANEAGAEAVASSPFLYARLRSRIAAERARREDGESWLTMLGVVWRAAPAMALLAVCAFVLFWSASIGGRSNLNLSVESLLGPRGDAGIEQVVFADSQRLSSDDVLATIINEDEQGASR